jgi:hypothetical protein
MNFAQRLERLETGRRPFGADGIATMNGEQLRVHVARTLQGLGGQAAALDSLRADPATDPDTLKMVEAWPAWPL